MIPEFLTGQTTHQQRERDLGVLFLAEPDNEYTDEKEGIKIKTL